MAVNTEVRRSLGQAPRCIEPPAVLEAIDEVSPRGVDVNVAEALARDFIFSVCILLRISDVEVAADVLDVEWSEAAADVVVAEGMFAEMRWGGNICRRPGCVPCGSRRRRGSWRLRRFWYR